MRKAQSSLAVLVVVAAVGAAYVAATRPGDAKQSAATGKPPRALSSSAATKPASAAAVPFVIPRVRAMPPEHQVLLKRSIFALSGRPRESGRDQREAAAAPEARFVLRGVTEQAGRVTALVEDIASHRVLRLSAGDRVAGGRLMKVGLDGLVFEAGEGGATDVTIGHTFAGAPAPPQPVARKPDKKGNGEKDAPAPEKRKGEKDAATAATPQQ